MVENTQRDPDVGDPDPQRDGDELFRRPADDPTAGSQAAAEAPAGRQDWTEADRTGATPHDSDAVRAEAERLQAERAARRQARLDALRPKPAPVPEPVAASPEGSAAVPAGVATARSEGGVEQPRVATAAAVPAGRPPRTTDRPGPSLGLFLLRLAVAALVGVDGLNNLLAPAGTRDMLARTVLPSSDLIVMVLGGVQVAVAVLLVLGLATRLAGLVVAVIAGGMLAFVLWGPWSVFRLGEQGFVGDREVLLAAAGLLLLFVGGGGWAVDRGFRRRRATSREARADV